MPGGRLGKGVDALFGSADITFEHSARLIPIGQLHPNPDQPRKRFTPQDIGELAASIRSYGVIQPLIVEERGLNDYIIIAGERRWRAARQARLAEVPAICRAGGETERLELSVVENIQRSQLTPLEEARAYRAILDQTRLTQEQLAERVGKSRSAVANTIRMLTLPDSVQRLLDGGQLTAGHARAVLMISDPAIQRRAAAEMVRDKLSVRESEQLAQTHTRRHAEAHANADAPVAAPTVNYELLAVEDKMRERLGTKVKINGDSEQGKIHIYYHSLTDLNRIYKLICGIQER